MRTIVAPDGVTPQDIEDLTLQINRGFRDLDGQGIAPVVDGIDLNNLSQTIHAAANTSDHDTLTNVPSSTAHLLFLLLDGTRPMTGDLNMAENDILDVTAIKGDYTVSATAYNWEMTPSDGLGGHPQMTMQWTKAGYTATGQLTPNYRIIDSVTQHLWMMSDGLYISNAGAGGTGSIYLADGQFVSFLATGTAPLKVASTTMIANLNADLLDGYEGAALAALAEDETVAGSWKFASYIDLGEIAPPGVAGADTLRLYVEDYKGFSFPAVTDSGGMRRKLLRDSVFVGKAAENIALGQAVYASGSDTDVPLLSLAKADAIGTMPAIGVAVEAITSGAYGRVMQTGILENVDTSSFAAGALLYVSATVAGAPTATAPLYPNIRQALGTVLAVDAAVGSVQIIARSMFNEGILDHGGLLGLADDDHPQYAALAQNELITGDWTFGGSAKAYFNDASALGGTEYITSGADTYLDVHWADADSGCRFYSGANLLFTIKRVGGGGAQPTKTLLEAPVEYAYDVGGVRHMGMSASVVTFNVRTQQTAGRQALVVDANFGTRDGTTEWGAGYDAGIGYDGTNLQIRPARVGTGYVNIFKDTDAASVAMLTLEGDRATETDGDEIYMSFKLSNGAEAQTEFARICCIATDIDAPSGGAEDGALGFKVMVGGALTQVFETSSDGAEFARGMRVEQTTISAATTLSSAHYIVLCDTDTAGAAFTVTLPAAASHAGRVYYIKNTGSSGYDVTVDANGAETIDDAATQTVTDKNCMVIVSDSTAWWII